MSNIMRFKGYSGTVEYSAEDKLFYGQIAFINDTVLFEGESVKELENNFKEAVNHYIESCKRIGREPQKVFKGLFPARINPEIHKKAALVALKRKISLNKLVELAIEHEIEASC
jgi:predicted HicB family RNase H-like nuclease